MKNISIYEEVDGPGALLVAAGRPLGHVFRGWAPLVGGAREVNAFLEWLRFEQPRVQLEKLGRADEDALRGLWNRALDLTHVCRECGKGYTLRQSIDHFDSDAHYTKHVCSFTCADALVLRQARMRVARDIHRNLFAALSRTA